MGHGVVRLQDGFRVEHRPVTGCELTPRETGEDAATLGRPLGAMSGRGKTLRRRQRNDEL